jgi:hypothetical protein
MPDPDPGKLVRMRKFVRRILNEHFKPLPFADAVTRQRWFEEWLAHYNKPLKTKEEFREIYLSLGVLTEDDYRCKSFAKKEFYAKENLPRYINSRTNRFKARVAGSCHKIEEAIFHGVWEKFFVKGRKVSEQPLLISRMGCFPLFLQTDYTSYESGFSPEYVDAVECELWRFFLSENPDLLEDYMKVYQVGGQPRKEHLDGRYFYGKVYGARMSGEMWTSLANGFSNLMNFWFLCEEKGVSRELVDALVEGDDGLFGMAEEFLTEQDFADLGFKIKMEYVRVLQDTSFCSNIFHPTTNQQMISPEQIVRVNWTCNPLYQRASMVVQRRLLKSKAMSLYCTGKHTPIAQTLALKLISLLAEEKELVGDEDMWWHEWVRREDMNFVRIEIPLENRLLWAEKFGVSVQMQHHFERKIEKANNFAALETDFRFFPFVNEFLMFEGPLAPKVSGLKKC